MNGLLKWQLEFEQWALNTYDYSCPEFGADNNVSFIVHCDGTNPYAHGVVDSDYARWATECKADVWRKLQTRGCCASPADT